ncbi:MAG: DUF445 domain-containing protein [Firmicutes bacterium]|nr:DUF445 domain-containing protein [Bacillota bacterium]
MQRRWANVALVVALVLFIGSLWFRHQLLGQYIESMALAGLAGGIADWYAVTALFRHPLGLRWLPHTSIISANRDRIIEAISTLVEQELLSVSFIEANIEKLKIGTQLIRVLRAEASGIDNLVRDVGTELLDILPLEQAARFIAEFAESKSDHIVVSDYLVNILRWLIQSGNDQSLFRFLSRHVITVLDSVEFTEDMEQRLKTLLENYTKTTTQKLVLGLLESLGTVDYQDLSRTVKEQLIQWLQSEKAVEQFELALVRIMLTLRDDETLRSRIESVKQETVQLVPWQRIVDAGASQLREILNQPGFGTSVSNFRRELAQMLEDNPEHQQVLESMVKRSTVNLVRRYHPVVGRLVRDNLTQMNEREWIDKLEWYVGRDLQWIRVNGALVGGLVGLVLSVLIHALLHA